MSDKKKDKDKKKKKQSVLEAEIFRFMEKSLKSAMEVALDDIFKDWPGRKFCVSDFRQSQEWCLGSARS